MAHSKGKSGREIGQEYVTKARGVLDGWQAAGGLPHEVEIDGTTYSAVKDDGTANVALLSKLTGIPYRRWGTNPALKDVLAEINDFIVAGGVRPREDAGAVAQVRRRLTQAADRVDALERQALDRTAEFEALNQEIQRLRQAIADRDRRIRELESRLAVFERSIDVVAETGLWLRP